MEITLYEFGPTRSARVRWVLQELDLPFESISNATLPGSAEIEHIHPLRKLPAMLIDGEPMFESAAICTFLADAHPDKGLIPAAGTRQRALHEQWSYYCMTEIEPHSWSNFRNTFFYPEERRVPEIVEQNNFETGRSLKALNSALEGKDYILGDQFQVTDIIVGYAVNGAPAAAQLRRRPA